MDKNSSTKDAETVVSANSAFSADLYQALKESHPKNLIYSAFGLSSVVGMAQLGTGVGSETASEICKTFRWLPENNATLGNGFSQVLASLQKESEGYVLATANRLYSNTGFGISPSYAKQVKEYFLAEIEQLDFSQNVKAAKSINSWVEESTRGKITNLIAPDELDAMTRLVLVNGIYFKGLWKDQFKKENTKKAPFYLSENDTVMVDMMHLKKKFAYAELEDLDAHAVSLPYQGDRLSMILIAPKEKTGLSKIENGLRNYDPETLLAKLYKGDEVAVRLPKFKLEATLPLVPILKKMGISSMFSLDADFSGITESGEKEELYASDIVQKAFIEVNEEGSEAAAATSMRLMARSIPFVITFDADRPFCFQIVDLETKLILFAGRCCNPLQTE